MASKKNRARASKDAAPRKFKKKTSALVIEKVEYVDYKDVDLLSRFISDRAKIRNRRVSGNDVQQQREVANAIKVAREMALLPYAKRVANQRKARRHINEHQMSRCVTRDVQHVEGEIADSHGLAFHKPAGRRHIAHVGDAAGSEYGLLDEIFVGRAGDFFDDAAEYAVAEIGV